jgi:amidase
VTDELTHRSAADLAASIRRREVTCVELMDAHLAAIERWNPSVNAVVAVAPDARTQAATADRALATGIEPGPLHGVPFTVKDIMETADLPTTLGMRALAGNRPKRDATIVARMRSAGAILLGKTNCPPGGGGGETENELFGRTNNPYDRSLSPGGSSGGEAAAIASGMSPCGFGSDSGGSLRMPAHLCGIATIRPTAGRVSVAGVLDETGPLGPMSDPRTQPGPLARRVEDLALLLSVVAGPDPRDAGTIPVLLAPPLRGIKGRRVVLHVLDDAPMEEGIEDALVAAASALTDAGAHVENGAPPPGGHELTLRIWQSYGDAMKASDFYAVARAWDIYRSTMLRWLTDERVDLILTPASTHAAQPPGSEMFWRYLTPYAMTGWPCAVVRAGESKGLPVGVQLVAGPWREQIALAGARVIEDATGGWQPPPGA